MINYNIADLVSRINNVIATNGRNSLVNVPYTKDNYQVLIQLTKLGVLSIMDNKSTSHICAPQWKAINSQVNYITAKLHSPIGKTTLDNQQLIDQRAITKNESILPPKRGQSGFSFIPQKGDKFAPIYTPSGGINSHMGTGQESVQQKLKLKIISKPGRRVYVSYNDLKDFNHGFKTYLLRTSKGIISSHTAINLKIGGELLIKLTIV